MKSTEAIKLLTDLGDRFSNIHVVIPVPDGPQPEDVEDAIIDLQREGYGVYVERTARGEQIVVTDKRFSGNSGLARRSVS